MGRSLSTAHRGGPAGHRVGAEHPGLTVPGFWERVAQQGFHSTGKTWVVSCRARKPQLVELSSLQESFTTRQNAHGVTCVLPTSQVLILGEQSNQGTLS